MAKVPKKKKAVGRGKFLRITVEVNFGFLADLVNRNTDFRVGVLYNIGRTARKYLQRSPWIRTQSPHKLLKFKGVNKDSVGKYKVRNVVTKGGKSIVFTSPPMNLFEFGREYEGKPKQPARLILTGKFRKYLERNVARLANAGIVKTLAKMKATGGMA